ncbi:unnamed protein product [Cuscuta epithymum]|uniref:NADP-dependent oxidoreductase domain-containing protein n=1 Tax=Cuscuta epithymum TaxID=186058 RepID=A0AAV0FM61_9ASTE|nr:unnamed protein product [Cuscuta epithymum]
MAAAAAAEGKGVKVPRMKLGSQGLEVSAQGLGCMGMSAFYGPPKPDADMISLIHHAVNSGVTFLDTSDMYGPHTNEILLGKLLPRFQAENLAHNKKLYERIVEIAAKKGCTPSQLALAWVHHQGNDVCSIPGTTKIENFNQNIGALTVKLTAEDMAELEKFASADLVKGDRYTPDMATWKRSDTPPLSTWKAA